MKNTILISIISLLLIIPQIAKASHGMGGEITWKCISSGPNVGKYIFSIKAYRECASVIYGNSVGILSNSPAGYISLSLVSGYPKDISPNCNSAYPQITCAGAATTNIFNTGAVSEYLFESDTVTLNGIPPATGWTFTSSIAGANRSYSTNLYSSTLMKLAAKMYANNNTNASICYDNSPQFANIANTVLKAGSLNHYNYATYDSDLDSLYFEWGQPLENNGYAPYQMNYSYTSPLPDTLQNINNIGATIDHQTGEISFLSYTTGAFLTNVKVSSYRNNQLISETWREVQLIIIPDDTNQAPTISFNNNIFEDTVYAGDSISFPINVTDVNFHPNGSPQEVFLHASSLQFGNYITPTSTGVPTYDTQNGCPQIPCATLTPAPNDTTPLSAVFSVQTHFNWVTNCNHLNSRPDGSQGPRTHYFNFYIKDDYCPIPAENNFTYAVTVLPNNPSNVLKTEIKSVNILPNDDINIKWLPIIDPNNFFLSYNLYESYSIYGPFILIDSITNPNILSYTHNSISTAANKYFKITTHQTNCANDYGSNSSQISKNIILNVSKENNCVNKPLWTGSTIVLSNDLKSLVSYYKVFIKVRFWLSVMI